MTHPLPWRRAGRRGCWRRRRRAGWGGCGRAGGGTPLGGIKGVIISNGREKARPASKKISSATERRNSSSPATEKSKPRRKPLVHFVSSRLDFLHGEGYSAGVVRGWEKNHLALESSSTSELFLFWIPSKGSSLPKSRLSYALSSDGREDTFAGGITRWCTPG